MLYSFSSGVKGGYAIFYSRFERGILRYIYGNKTEEEAVEKMRRVANVLDPTGYLASRLNRRYLGQPRRLISLFRLLALEKPEDGVGN